MKWMMRRVKLISSYPNEVKLIKLPKELLVEIEDIKRRYSLELKNKRAKLDDLQGKKVGLDYDINAYQSLIKTLAPSSEIERIAKIIEGQDISIQKKEDERKSIEEEQDEIKRRYNEIENHLNIIIKLHKEAASAFQVIEQERDQALNDKNLSQNDLKKLSDSHLQEIERINGNYQQEIRKQRNLHQQEVKKLKSRLREFESGDDNYHKTELRKDLLIKSTVGFYTVLFMAVISFGLSTWLTISIIQDKRSYDQNHLNAWQRIIALVTNVGVTSTSVWFVLVRRDRRYEDKLNEHRAGLETYKELNQQDHQESGTTQE